MPSRLTTSQETEDVLFASLDNEQREQLRDLLLVLRDGLAAEADGACTGAEAEQ